jgi:hypothetical protein
MKARRLFSHPPVAVGLAVYLALVGSATAAESPISIESKVDQGELLVRYQGRKLLVYAFATNQFKPYVRELYTLRGENVLRDAPPDHLHHHGMMFAVCVNGINFWEEKTAPGIEKHIELPVHSARIDAQGTPVADFTEIIYWLAPTNATAPDSLTAALLVERRTLTLKVDETNQEVALRWDSHFQVGPNAGTVLLHGPNYNGLGVRLPESFNHVAKFENSSPVRITSPNTQTVQVTRWTSAAGLLGGRPVMLAMFGRRDNRNGDARFFTMLDPFAYLSATQGLDEQPVGYVAGDKFSLSYLLTVYSENKPPEFVRRRCELWEKDRK